jgi:hypothetical protein
VLGHLGLKYLVEDLLGQGGHAGVAGEEVFEFVGAWGRNLKVSHRFGLLWVNLSGTNSNIADGGGFFRPTHFTAR